MAWPGGGTRGPVRAPQGDGHGRPRRGGSGEGRRAVYDWRENAGVLTQDRRAEAGRNLSAGPGSYRVMAVYRRGHPSAL